MIISGINISEIYSSKCLNNLIFCQILPNHYQLSKNKYFEIFTSSP